MRLNFRHMLKRMNKACLEDAVKNGKDVNMDFVSVAGIKVQTSADTHNLCNST